MVGPSGCLQVSSCQSNLKIQLEFQIKQNLKQTRVLCTMQELEKFKFVLDYKIKELKKQIEPKEEQITDMKDQVKVC